MNKIIDLKKLRKHKEAYLDSEGAAEALGVCKRTISTYIKKGTLPTRHIGGNVYIAVADILKLFDKPQKK